MLVVRRCLLKEGGDFIKLLVLPVGDSGLLLVPLLSGDVQTKVSPEPISGSYNGTLVKRVNRENTPFLGSHWKYRIPPTEPSFLPVKS